jgi:hypothetical protein
MKDETNDQFSATVPSDILLNDISFMHMTCQQPPHAPVGLSGGDRQRPDRMFRGDGIPPQQNPVLQHRPLPHRCVPRQVWLLRYPSVLFLWDILMTLSPVEFCLCYHVIHIAISCTALGASLHSVTLRTLSGIRCPPEAVQLCDLHLEQGILYLYHTSSSSLPYRSNLRLPFGPSGDGEGPG